MKVLLSLVNPNLILLIIFIKQVINIILLKSNFMIFLFESPVQLAWEPPHKDKILGSNQGPGQSRLLSLCGVSTATIARDIQFCM